MAQKVAFLTMAFFLAGISGMGYGEEHCWRHAPTLYNAVHFHEDDVGDAGWSESLRVPTEGLPTGVYGVLLKQGSRWQDWVPFFVRPPTPQSDVAFLVPTVNFFANPFWGPLCTND